MRALRWWSLLLVPGGFVAGHELGYQGAAALGSAPAPGGGHGYLSLLLLVGTPLATAALARGFLAGLRAQLPPVRLRTLALAQVALFLAVELAEHAAAGLDPARTLTQPAVALGLVAQVVVAVALTLIVRTTHDAGLALARARRRPVPGVRPPWRPSRRAPVTATAWSPASPTRGPPRVAPA